MFEPLRLMLQINGFAHHASQDPNERQNRKNSYVTILESLVYARMESG